MTKKKGKPAGAIPAKAQRSRPRKRRAFRREALTQDVADEFDVSARTVHDWVARGCPCTRGPKGNRFDMPEVAKWKKDHNITGEPGRPVTSSPAVDSTKLRKENALAAIYEMRAAREMGHLIDVAAARTAGLTLVTTARNKWMGFGAAMAPQLEGLPAVEIQTLLESRVEEILNELADGFTAAFVGLGGMLSATPAAQAQRVGGEGTHPPAEGERGIGQVAQ